MHIPLVDLVAQYARIKADVDASMQRVVDGANFILGEEVATFERAFADYVGTRDAAGVASGTAALHLALLACGIGPGDEVITVAHTFTATAEAIVHTGARPVFVDVQPDTYNIDPNMVEEAVTARTKALIAVHLYGQPAAMDPLLEIARRRGLWVIEDAAQAHASTYHGQRCGSIGHLACFSFYPGKNLGAYGDAGIVTSNDDSLLSKVRQLRDHGRSSKYMHEEIGWGERLDALQAAILRAKLPYLEAWTEARRAHARQYDRLLDASEVVTPFVAPDVRHVYHLYVVRSRQRDALLAHLHGNGVDAGVHYPVPLHRQPAYLRLGFAERPLPVTERLAGEILSLPMYPELTDEQISYVAESVKEFADASSLLSRGTGS